MNGISAQFQDLSGHLPHDSSLTHALKLFSFLSPPPAQAETVVCSTGLDSRRNDLCRHTLLLWCQGGGWWGAGEHGGSQCSFCGLLLLLQTGWRLVFPCSKVSEGQSLREASIGPLGPPPTARGTGYPAHVHHSPPVTPGLSQRRPDPHPLASGTPHLVRGLLGRRGRWAEEETPVAHVQPPSKVTFSRCDRVYSSPAEWPQSRLLHGSPFQPSISPDPASTTSTRRRGNP